MEGRPESNPGLLEGEPSELRLCEVTRAVTDGSANRDGTGATALVPREPWRALPEMPPRTEAETPRPNLPGSLSEWGATCPGGDDQLPRNRTALRSGVPEPGWRAASPANVRPLGGREAPS